MYQKQIVLVQSDGYQVHLHINFSENERNSYRNQTGLREIEINYIVPNTVCFCEAIQLSRSQF